MNESAATQAMPRLAEHPLGLPNELQDYIRSPRATWTKAMRWLNSRWQLRGCASVGRWVRVSGRVHVQNAGRIILHDRVQLHCHYVSSVLATFPGGTLEIGERTAINYGADIAATKLVRIGADCLIGTHVVVLDTDFHDAVDHTLVPESRPVIIGDNVFIGNRVTILPGVTIGDGAVVGAGSVVMSDVPSRTVAMGNPARVVRKF